MWPADTASKPANIPDDLWHDIQRTKDRMITFLADAQNAALEEESLGNFDSAFYEWLEPIANAIKEMRIIKRNGPSTATVIPFPINLEPAG